MQVLPLQTEMKNPEKFNSPLGVLNIGNVIVTVLLLVMGFVGYLKYGEEVEGSLTLNLPQDNVWVVAHYEFHFTLNSLLIIFFWNSIVIPSKYSFLAIICAVTDIHKYSRLDKPLQIYWNSKIELTCIINYNIDVKNVRTVHFTIEVLMIFKLKFWVLSKNA